MEDSIDEDFIEILSKNCAQSEAAWSKNPNASLYLAQLSSYGVQRLAQEPECLVEEQAAILEQTQDLAFHNYKTFIQTAECSREIFKDFGTIEGTLDSLLDHIPNFINKCSEFTSEAQNISTRWRQISLILSKHPQLLEVLEMPQLMDTCVRNGYFDEALELSAYVQRLENKYSSSIPLIKSIANEVQDSLQLMLNQLLQQLRANIQLPTCLKVIGYLRRMDIFSESELRLKFLQARDSWFQSVLDAVPDDDAYSHLTKVIETCRVNLFDVVTQYRAIFSEEDLSWSLPGRDSTNTESAILPSWIMHKVAQFLALVQKDLSRDLMNRIDAILAQCMYFGLSFSRVGADFRPLLLPVFYQAVLDHFKNSCRKATNRFDELMQSFTLSSFSTQSSVSVLSSVLSLEENLQPPLSLLEFHPLAVYCNCILSAFNELRLCIPLALATDASFALQDSLTKVASIISDYHITEQSSFTKNEQESFNRLCVIFATELLPYLNKCLSVLFSSDQYANSLGITTTELNKLNDCKPGFSASAVLKPIEHLLIIPDEEEAGIVLNIDSLSVEVEKDHLQATEPEASEN